MTSSLITSLIVVHFLSQALIGSFNLLSRADKELWSNVTVLAWNFAMIFCEIAVEFPA